MSNVTFLSLLLLSNITSTFLKLAWSLCLSLSRVNVVFIILTVSPVISTGISQLKISSSPENKTFLLKLTSPSTLRLLLKLTSPSTSNRDLK